MISYLKRLSIVTTHPDADWLKIFALLFIIGVLSLGWNIYFFFTVKHNLTSTSQVGQTTGATISNEEEERMKKVIDSYDARAEAHSAIIKDAPEEVADPAGA